MKFILRKERINKSGYDYTGMYWGIGLPIYYFREENTDNYDFIRAVDREDAKRKIKERFPEATFYR